MLDPLALIKLRSTGSCDFEIPEVLYDMDHPGQYFRRIKSVSVSLPCIAGPYTSISAKLSLGISSYRKSKVTSDGYRENDTPGTDERFVHKTNADQAIATSNAQNDSGVFELNFRDERYLPFEGTGAISSWKLELPSEIRQFDYNTISDVIIHLKYTAKEGGELLKLDVIKELKKIKEGLSQEKFHVTINMKHDLPNEWLLLKQNGIANLVIDKSRLPYMAQTLDAGIESVMFVAKNKTDSIPAIKIDTVDIDLSTIDEINLYTGVNSNINIALETPFNIESPDLEELIMVVKYKF